MKKLLLFIAACLTAGISEAADYNRLLIRAKDGTETCVLSQNLRITVAEENLILSHSGGTASLPIAELTSMQFISADTRIDDLLATEEGEIDIYTLQGHHAGRFPSVAAALERIEESGIYVVVAKSGTIKIFIDK